MIKKPSDFYNSISGFYDEMTQFSTRLEKSVENLGNLFGDLEIEKGLDVACGTGIYTLAMSKMGIESWGSDISADSLNKARKNSETFKLKADFLQSSMDQLKEKFDCRFDAVLCLGNSLPHLTGVQKLNDTIKCFSTLMKKDGFVGVQLINYEKFLKDRVKKFNDRSHGNTRYIRYYRYLADFIIFNILMLKKSGNYTQKTLFSTKLFPFKKNDVAYAFKQAGFKDIRFYNDLSLGEFNSDNSENIVVTGRK